MLHDVRKRARARETGWHSSKHCLLLRINLDVRFIYACCSVAFATSALDSRSRDFYGGEGEGDYFLTNIALRTLPLRRENEKPFRGGGGINPNEIVTYWQYIAKARITSARPAGMCT